MAENIEPMKEIAHEITYRRYLLSKDDAKYMFKDINIAEYIVLHYMCEQKEKDSIYSDKIYLSEISEKLNLPIRKTSKLIREMNGKNLVEWDHDGNGKDGTYVTITEHGMKVFEETDGRLREFYTRILEKLGKEKVVELLQLMKEFDSVMRTELEQMEDNNETDD
ncbi:MAG: MarR family winged helix-turn-helix transcriptional regulator [Clostridiales bacterium]|nr:MarR family winged helix-turn-helix transcriptional regulator [Clostridiales bacterium]